MIDGVEEKNNKDWKVIVIVIFLSFMAFALWVGSIVYGCTLEEEREEQRKTELLNAIETKDISSCILKGENDLRNNSDFVLGVVAINSSSIKNFEYYFYMIGNKGNKLQHLNSENVEIVIDDTCSPHIERHFSENGDVIYKTDYSLLEDRDFVYDMTHYILYLPSNYSCESYNDYK